MKKLIAILLLLLSSSVSLAEEFTCTVNINDQLQSLTYSKFDIDDDFYANTSLREMLFGGSEKNTCPAYISLRHLTPGLTDQQRSVFCLQYDDEKDSYIGFAPGERDAYLNCRVPSKSYCQYVNESKEAVLAAIGVGAGAAGGATLTGNAAGVTAVSHSSGAVILTGNSGYIAGTLGSLGTSIFAALTSPITITATGLSLVAVGTSVYACLQ